MEISRFFYIPSLLNRTESSALKESWPRILSGKYTNLDSSILFATIQAFVDEEAIVEKRKAKHVSRIYLGTITSPQYIEAFLD